MNRTLFIAPLSSMTFILSALAPASAQAQRPVVLKLETPREDAIQYEHGWPLRFSIRPRDDANFEFYNDSSQAYPSPGDRAALIFVRSQCSSVINPDICAPNDFERFVKFVIDTDTPGVSDAYGYQGNVFDQVAYRPTYLYGTDASDPASLTEVRLGPTLPDSERDGVGYGPNDDLPGFVLLSNVGVGRVLTSTPSFDGGAQPLTEPAQLRARNLAGLMTEVSMELRATSRQTVIRTGLTVPPELFAPIVIWDSCVNDGRSAPSYECPGRIRYHVDGGPAVYSEGFVDNGPFLVGDIDVTTPSSPNVVEVEITAMLVQGDAPAFVDDCTQDGEINQRDLRCMGYEVISNQVRRTFIQARVHTTCDEQSARRNAWPGPGAQAFEVDFDGFDFDEDELCPSSPGRITRPPN
ncbi:MAG: hypothetical protein AAFZ18_07655 [Myxococcota bacterium]